MRLVARLLILLGLVFAALTDSCMMGMLLAKLPWNRSAPACSPSKGGQ